MDMPQVRSEEVKDDSNLLLGISKMLKFLDG